MAAKGADCKFCKNRKVAGLGPCGWHGGEKGSKKPAAVAKPRKARRGGRRRELEPVEVAPATADDAILGDTSALKALAKTFAEGLKKLRSKLDVKIAHVEEIAAIL